MISTCKSGHIQGVIGRKEGGRAGGREDGGREGEGGGRGERGKGKGRRRKKGREGLPFPLSYLQQSTFHDDHMKQPCLPLAKKEEKRDEQRNKANVSSTSPSVGILVVWCLSPFSVTTADFPLETVR